jgi:FkbM family methyltransferase
MTDAIRRIRRLQRRIRALWRVMPLLDAVRLALSESSPGEIRVYLRPIAKKVVLRRQTTDVRCLEKVFVSDEYDPPFQLLPRVIVDAGANVGMATLFFAQRYPQAKILAIEPEASNFEMLKQNCQSLPNITLVRAALWPEHRELKIENPVVDAWAFSISDECGSSDGSPRVPAITVTDILDRLCTDHIDLMKIDIEGSELHLFSRNSDKWLGQVHFIVIELHDRLIPGCSHAFYSALVSRKFSQELRGENVFVKMVS